MKTQKKTIQTWLTYNSPKGEYTELASETQPNEVKGIKDMLKDHLRGIPTHGNEGVYLPEDIDVPDPRTLDLSELHDLKEFYKQQSKDIESELRKQQRPKGKTSAEGDKPLPSEGQPPSEPPTSQQQSEQQSQ